MALDPDEKRSEPQPQVLGSYLRAQRQLAALSLRQLADMADVSNAYLSQVERGLHQPSLKVLRSIAAALNLSTDALLSQAGFSDLTRPTGRGTAPTARDGSSTEAAIRNDPDLTEAEREALLAVYRQLRDRHA